MLGNYNITYNTAEFTINKRDATWTTSANSKTYADADPNPLTTGSGDFLVADGVTATYSRQAGETVAGSPYHITATLSAGAGVLDNYTITNTGAAFTINKRDATWTTNPNSKTYGDADPSPLTTGSGDFLAADNVTATYSRATGEMVTGGPYHITATLSAGAGVLNNYTITNTGAAFTINPRPATWTTNPNSKTYGDLDPNSLTTGSGSGFLSGDNVTATYSRAAGETVLGGPYHITATLGPAGVLSNYSITNAGANFTINPRPATWTTNANSKTYGDADPNPLTTGGGSGFVVSDGVNASYSRAAGETVPGGPYHITATLIPAGALSNYTITNTGADFTISPRPATVTADNKSKVYGDPNPVLTATVTNTKNGDVVNYTLATTALQFSNVSTYPITVTLGSNPNYSITSTDGTLTIGKANLTIKADNKQIFLHAALPTFTVTYTGFLGTDTPGSLTGVLTFTPTTTPANAGTYDIVPSGLTSNNYTITFQKGTLTVNYSTTCIIFGDPTHAILQPINPDGTSVNKAGSTVPAKFRVGDANCNSIGTPGVVTSFKLIGTMSDVNTVVNEDVVSTTPDTAFRWDPSAQQWIFNISTKGMKAGVKYTYQISLNDNTSIIFSFALR